MQPRDENPAAFLIPIFTPLAWVLVGYPVLGWLWARWTESAVYAYGLPVFLLALYVGWRLWPRGVTWQGHDLGLVTLGALVVAYILVSGRGMPAGAAALWVAVGAAMVWAVAGRQVLRRVWPAFGLVFVAIPWPVVAWAGAVLGQEAATIAAAVSRIIGLSVSAHQDVLLGSAGQPLVHVGEEGTWLLAASFALAVVFAVLFEGPRTTRVALPAVALGAAVIVTIGRAVFDLVLVELTGPISPSLNLVLDVGTFATVGGLLFVLARRGGCVRVRPELWGPRPQ